MKIIIDRMHGDKTTGPEIINAAAADSVYARVQEWERRLAKVRASCCACVFPDGYEGANRVGSGQTPVGDVVDGLLGSDEFKSYQPAAAPQLATAPAPDGSGPRDLTAPIYGNLQFSFEQILR